MKGLLNLEDFPTTRNFDFWLQRLIGVDQAMPNWQCIALGHILITGPTNLDRILQNTCDKQQLFLKCIGSTVSSRMPSGFEKVLWSAFGQSSLFG